MKRFVLAALAAATALASLAQAGGAAADPHWHDHDHGHGHDRGHGQDHWREHDGWRRDHGPHHWRYYGGHYGYSGYRGRWREGQRYPYWRDRRYVVEDWRGYDLPPPRPGYRYYRDDNGDIVMAAIASGVIGLIVGGALAN